MGQEIPIAIRRGTSAELAMITLDEGELGFTTDENKLYIGNSGNTPVSGSSNRLNRIAASFAVPYNPSSATCDMLIGCDCTAGAVLVTISNEDVADGALDDVRTFVIVDETGFCSNINTITIALESGTINGNATYIMNTSRDSRTLYVDGTNGFIY
jgi:hypothetical protein